MASGVFDLEGELIAEANDQNPVVVTQVDLNQQFLWPWLGDLNNRIPREKPSSETTAQAQSHLK
ncbi:MAG: hypothetical protein U9R49_09605 [Bacteroidota bacterium]|nr:hypothetical protein [Bacteroidota bacterium]